MVDIMGVLRHNLRMAKILLIHGPNLNLLGTREPDVYGNTTLENINNQIQGKANSAGHELLTLQSNAEHELVGGVQQAGMQRIDFIIINPAAFTHTSIALRDALLAVKIPFIEVHLSNTQAREDFRHHSYLADIAIGTIAGFGPYSYELALDAACHHLTNQR